MLSSIDTIWLMLCAVLVFFMQAGFAMLETGFTRLKNAGNIIMKNIMDFAIGSICFWILGYSLMYGDIINGIVGTPSLFFAGNAPSNVPSVAFLVWQIFFCATSATITSGAMAERTKFIAYVLYSVAITAVVYPLIGSWIWNDNGWLAQLGFHDFAGSTVVHTVGGISALIGAKMLGPRIGKYHKGKSRAIAGQNITIAALGVFVLWIGWYGFNAGSTLGASSDEQLATIATIFLNTTICPAASAVVAMAITWKRYSKSDITMTLNAIIAGLVAITAGCDQINPIGALCIGALTGYIMVFAIEFLDEKLHIDDPVGAVAVHGISGIVGTVLVGAFSVTQGFLFTGEFYFFGVQILGSITVVLATAVFMSLVFLLISKTVGLRVDAKDEVRGLDQSEHGLAPVLIDLAANDIGVGLPKMMEISKDTELDASAYKADGKIRKVVIVMSPSKFTLLREAVDNIDITGMTVTQVSGCGIQKGKTEYYRGTENVSHLLPKVKVEIVISTVPLGLLIDTIKKTLYTGNIGDGKIFVYEVENVIKVRTNEEGKMALE